MHLARIPFQMRVIMLIGMNMSAMTNKPIQDPAQQIAMLVLANSFRLCSRISHGRTLEHVHTHISMHDALGTRSLPDLHRCTHCAKRQCTTTVSWCLSGELDWALPAHFIPEGRWTHACSTDAARVSHTRRDSHEEVSPCMALSTLQAMQDCCSKLCGVLHSP